MRRVVAVPLLPTSQLRPPLGATRRAARKAGSPQRAAGSASPSPGEPSKTQGTRRARSGPCVARRCAAYAFRSNSPSVSRATQAGACPRDRGVLPWWRRGHAGRAPRPEDAAPARPRLALVFREDRPRPSQETNGVKSCLLFQSRFFFSFGHPHGSAQCRPAPLHTCLLPVRLNR